MQFAKEEPDKEWFGYHGQSQLYTKIRPTYPQELYVEIFNAFQKEKLRVCLDIGCGTGQITGKIASRFEKIFAIDISKK